MNREKTLESLKKQEVGTHVICDDWIFQLGDDGLWKELDIRVKYSSRELASILHRQSYNGLGWVVY